MAPDRGPYCHVSIPRMDSSVRVPCHKVKSRIAVSLKKPLKLVKAKKKAFSFWWPYASPNIPHSLLFLFKLKPRVSSEGHHRSYFVLLFLQFPPSIAVHGYCANKHLFGFLVIPSFVSLQRRLCDDVHVATFVYVS